MKFETRCNREAISKEELENIRNNFKQTAAQDKIILEVKYLMSSHSSNFLDNCIHLQHVYDAH